MYVSNQSILQKTFFGSMVLKRFVPGNLSNQQLGKMPICLTHVWDVPPDALFTASVYVSQCLLIPQRLFHKFLLIILVFC